MHRLVQGGAAGQRDIRELARHLCLRERVAAEPRQPEPLRRGFRVDPSAQILAVVLHQVPPALVARRERPGVHGRQHRVDVERHGMAVIPVAGVGTIEVDVAGDGLGGAGVATGRHAPRLPRGTDEAGTVKGPGGSGTDAPTTSANAISIVNLGMPA